VAAAVVVHPRASGRRRRVGSSTPGNSTPIGIHGGVTDPASTVPTPAADAKLQEQISDMKAQLLTMQQLLLQQKLPNPSAVAPAMLQPQPEPEVERPAEQLSTLPAPSVANPIYAPTGTMNGLRGWQGQPIQELSQPYLVRLLSADLVGIRGCRHAGEQQLCNAVTQVHAIYDHKPLQEGDLAFKTGDPIVVTVDEGIERGDVKNSWWYGYLQASGPNDPAGRGQFQCTHVRKRKNKPKQPVAVSGSGGLRAGSAVASIGAPAQIPPAAATVLEAVASAATTTQPVAQIVHRAKIEFDGIEEDGDLCFVKGVCVCVRVCQLEMCRR
jgi:hypothetical protein